MAKIPFTLEAWLKDKSQKVETREGRIVHDIWEVKNAVTAKEYRTEVCALIEGEEDALVFFKNGKYLPVNAESPYDLFIVTPEPELSEFEKKLSDVVGYAISLSVAKSQKPTSEFVKEYAAELLSIAREQFIKDGYVIEKKAFHDAVKNVEPEVMKEVSENIDLADFIQNLGERYPEVSFEKLTRIAKAAYDYGKAEALKDLPRWENIKIPPTDIAKVWVDALDSFWLQHKNKKILVQSLEKLPGFKED